MLCLGIAGGLNKAYENPLNLAGAFLHDGAAVIVKDGKVVAAVEEERLNRIKHSNKFPELSIQFCLESVGAKFSDLDAIGFYASETYCNALLAQMFAGQPDVPVPLDARQLLTGLLARDFGFDGDQSKLYFVPHHDAHAVSAFSMSGFRSSLVLAIDGYGDFLSGLVAVGNGDGLQTLKSLSQRDSLGLFYLEVVRFLGYSPFDEYKVMGLAPYGNPQVFRQVFSELYELRPNGEFLVSTDRIGAALIAEGAVRSKGTPFTQRHCDVAAALQEALEAIAFHIVRHWQNLTGERNLCLAGGVAHNCTMTGKLLFAELFDDIFVQPAAHDAGCALGAALSISNELGCAPPNERLRSVYWGPPLAEESVLEQLFANWQAFLRVERSDCIAEKTAGLIAEGAVVGWVQGRSEFGPRALGNRSILADPRPASNKDRINAMVKKREGFRPFAPSVIEEDAADFFDLPAGSSHFPFMNFVVPVREEKRSLLGAITHVDGTARIQTVCREDNRKYHDLIDQFKKLTGVPILLNTSFNNNAEPIVDSAEDAVVSFLTTDLDVLVVGPYLAFKREVGRPDWLNLEIALPQYARLSRTRAYQSADQMATVHEFRTSFSQRSGGGVSDDLFEALMTIEGRSISVCELLRRSGTLEEPDAAIDEIRDLWARRLIILAPPQVSASDPKQVAADSIMPMGQGQ